VPLRSRSHHQGPDVNREAEVHFMDFCFFVFFEAFFAFGASDRRGLPLGVTQRRPPVAPQSSGRYLPPSHRREPGWTPLWRGRSGLFGKWCLEAPVRGSNITAFARPRNLELFVKHANNEQPARQEPAQNGGPAVASGRRAGRSGEADPGVAPRESTQPRDRRCGPANYRPIAAELIAARAMRSRCLGR
jgi:hypothetical protein